MSNKRERQSSGGQFPAKSRYSIVHSRPKKAQPPAQLSPFLHCLPVQRTTTPVEQDFQFVEQLQHQLTMTKLNKQRELLIGQLRAVVLQQKNAMNAEEFKEFMDSMNLSQEELLLCGIETPKLTNFIVPDSRLLLEKLLALQNGHK
jgi:hypothetical protein